MGRNKRGGGQGEITGLFSGTPTAELYATDWQALSPGFYERNRSGLSPKASLEEFNFGHDRYSDFWDFLKLQTTDDTEVLQQRQQALEELIGVNRNPENLEFLDTAFRLTQQHQYLQAYIPIYDSRGNRIGASDRRVSLFLREAGDDPLAANIEYSNHDIYDVRDILLNLEKVRLMSLEAARALLITRGPGFLQKVLSRQVKLLQGLDSLNAQKYVEMEQHPPPPQVGHLRGKLKSSSSLLRTLSYADDLSRTLSELGWQSIGIVNSGQTEGLKGVWNLRFNPRNQVVNDHLKRPRMFVTGSNMSGKSLYTKAGFYAAAAAQTLGFAPAEGGQMVPRGALMLLEKPDSNPGEGLSSFGAEAVWWGEVLDKIQGLIEQNKIPAIWADEPFSSTDPEEQKLLIEAIMSHLQKIGATVVMATHADLSGLPQEYQHDFYHLATRTDEQGQPIFDYKLTEGHADSNALNVAALLGLPANIVARAKAVLGNQSRSKLRFPERSFPEPHLNQNVPAGNEEVNFGVSMFWTYPPLFGLINFDKIGDRDLQSIYNFDDRGAIQSFSHDPEVRADMWGYRMSGDMFNRLIWESGTRSPYELQKRQEFFNSLIGNETLHHALDADVDRLMRTIYALSWDHRGPYEKEIPRGYNPVQDWPGAVLALTEELLQYRDLSNENYATTSQIKRLKATLVMLDFLATAIPDRVDKLSRQTVDTMKDIAQACEDALITGDQNLEIHLTEAEREIMATFADKTKDYYYTSDFFSIRRDPYSQLSSKKWREQQLSAAYLPETLLDAAERIIIRLSGKQLPKLAISEFDPEIYATFAGQVAGVVRPFYETMEHKFSSHVLDMLDFLSSDEDQIAKVSTNLRSLDNLYGNQLAEHVDFLGREYFAGHSVGTDYLRYAKEMAAKPDDQLTYREMGDLTGRKSQGRSVYNDLTIIKGVIEMADWLKKRGLKPVQFNSGGQTAIEGAWLPVRESEQVKQNIMYSPNTRVDILSGPNMSGKTSLLKTQFWVHAMAQATGYAAAESADIPIYDRLIYLDRNPAREQEGLSSFGIEIDSWKRLLKQLEGAGPSLIALDEPFSSTDEKYQRALLEASLEYLIEAGHTVLVSTHNHRAVDNFLAHHDDANRAIETHRLKSKPGESGITFLYQRERGRASSYAIEVVKKLAGPALNSVIDQYVTPQF